MLGGGEFGELLPWSEVMDIWSVHEEVSKKLECAGLSFGADVAQPEVK